MNTENFVKNIFEKSGYQVSKIKEGKGKTPDFLITNGNEVFVVELKTKFDDPRKTKARTDSLLKGDVFEESYNTGRDNRISGIIKSSVKQLEQYSNKVDFKLLWLLASGRNQKSKFQQFQSSLYGSVEIFNHNEPNTPMKPCYYFTNSDFFRYRNSLDGAIISTMQGGRLLLNSFSNNRLKLKNSSICKLFPTIDPIDEELKGEAYLVSGNVDRNNEKEVLNYIKEKYNLKHIQSITLQNYSGTIIANEPNWSS